MNNSELSGSITTKIDELNVLLKTAKSQKLLVKVNAKREGEPAQINFTEQSILKITVLDETISHLIVE